ncbi:MAG: HEAT repeat domain-containing protein [Phycisphaerae bacterium]|nr:HEAT repeat domain-containing protein [Phycisphaerae bacterium]
MDRSTDGTGLPTRAPRPRGRAASLALAGGLLVLAACDSLSSDWDNFVSDLSPPTPAQAAAWASDLNDPENQRRGLALLSSAPWGGEAPYLQLYRLYVDEPTDPLVKATAIRALGRWGEPTDAKKIADYLASPSLQVRVEAARALQRLHDPAVVDRIWIRLVDEAEDPGVRTEIAIALAQYPSDRTFQALCLALDARELVVNLAAGDSLRILTGQDYGIDRARWLAWYSSTTKPFVGEEVFLYPTFTRTLTVLDHLAFWKSYVFEMPAPPRGMDEGGLRETYEPDPDRNIGQGP